MEERDKPLHLFEALYTYIARQDYAIIAVLENSYIYTFSLLKEMRASVHEHSNCSYIMQQVLMESWLQKVKFVLYLFTVHSQ